MDASWSLCEETDTETVEYEPELPKKSKKMRLTKHNGQWKQCGSCYTYYSRTWRNVERVSECDATHCINAKALHTRFDWCAYIKDENYTEQTDSRYSTYSENFKKTSIKTVACIIISCTHVQCSNYRIAQKNYPRFDRLEILNAFIDNRYAWNFKPFRYYRAIKTLSFLKFETNPITRCRVAKVFAKKVDTQCATRTYLPTPPLQHPAQNWARMASRLANGLSLRMHSKRSLRKVPLCHREFGWSQLRHTNIF